MQAVTVQQEPLRRLNALQVSKSAMFLCRESDAVLLSRRIKQPLYLSPPPPGKYSAVQGASFDTTCSGCLAGTTCSSRNITFLHIIECLLALSQEGIGTVLNDVAHHRPCDFMPILCCLLCCGRQLLSSRSLFAD
jgi:hypothetical protein